MSETVTTAQAKDPVDQVPPVGKLAVLGVQHVLAFYAGAVVVPLVIASGLGLDSATTIHLINADLFTCGIASIIQSAGLGPRIGVRLPLLQGVTFTAVSPLIAIGLANGGGTAGLGAMYGSIIAAGLLTFLAAPLFAKLLRFFPPVVTGTLLTIMGTTLMNVAASDIVSWGTNAEAGQDAAALTVRGLCYALFTLAVIVVVQWLFKGFVATISVLIGLVVGTLAALLLGDADFSAVGSSAVIGVTTPFYFGLPRFTVAGIISMVIVMAITAVETTGDVFATGEVVGRRITSEHIAKALRADGLSTLLGGILNSFPYTCFAQNVGLVRLSRVKSRWVVTAAGGIMIVLGLLPKAGAVVDSIPAPVIGGASLAMFASVAVVGIQTLQKVDLHDNRNAVIVSTSIGLALLVTLQPQLAEMVPGWLQIFFGSGVTLGAIVAIALNVLFFHVGPHRTPDVAVSDGRKISLEDVNQMSEADFVSTFGSLFSGPTWPVERAAQARPFASVRALREAFEDAVLTADPADQAALVNGYFDIAELIDEERGDGQARLDTGSIALDRMDDVQRSEIAAASAAYRERFGMPLVVCVANLASREQLIADAWRRVEHSPELERRVALGQIVDIAENRFDKLVADANPVRTAWARKFEQLER
ncbi:solute carrier family 23 protein [Propionibacterium australiense]|uniref:Permease family n=1 Tax=Propionibacterium australiense TaxID=119981 RepID=A0A383S7W4_9ACTN|nr:solute carrier family 23 protein [Propionibacterium australiense]RLP08499.1 uracil-xanthine permease [Propionibacterium australiense]RLP08567.1 uracil-xanthine permease [Propionibacterium australiense]SYZ33652.1 Permease family [Propionibacterium australiense]VEH88874.1 Putative purine permease ygfU [Propionibacterium australiense]